MNYKSAVVFQFIIEKMKKEHIEKQDLGWIEWESSSEIFSLAKKRIYQPNGDLEL